MERYIGDYPQMFDDLQKNILLFGEIDVLPTESVIVPFGRSNIDSDDDGFDGVLVSAVEKVKQPREDFE